MTYLDVWLQCLEVAARVSAGNAVNAHQAFRPQAGADVIEIARALYRATTGYDWDPEKATVRTP